MPEPPPDDRTVMPSPITAFGSATTHFSGVNVLPAGTRLGEFEIEGLIAEGGFGIVYAAYDHSLQRRVALKEYMPQAIGRRIGTIEVGANTERHAETFRAGLRSFVNEARLLAQFDHPSLVKVYRFWEGHGTAYMVMPLYDGVTLKEALQQRGDPPSEAWLKQLLAQLMDALALLHRSHCFHRDIAPDNILLLQDGRPLLLDFGAARRVIGDMTQALTVILKPGYAPIEQYAEAPSLKQGPWTDVYALAGVVYFAITGSAPAPAVARMMSDPVGPLAEIAGGRYSARFLNGIDRALAVKPDDRPQSIGEFARGLDIALSKSDDVTSSHRPRGIANDDVTVIHEPRPSEVRSAASGKKLGLIIGAGMLAIIAGVGYMFAPTWLELLKEADFLRKVVDATSPTPKEADTSPTPPQEPDATPAPPPATVDPTPAPPERRQFDPVQALDEVFQARNPDHSVAIALERQQVRIGKDPLRFTIRSSKPGYVYLLMVGTDRAHFNLLFPNTLDRDNRIQAGKEMVLPRPRWKLVPEGPPGTNQFIAIVSESPRQFDSAGIREVEPFAEFPLDEARARYAAHAGDTPLFAGRAKCPPQATACPESFGAAMFSIEEVGG